MQSNLSVNKKAYVVFLLVILAWGFSWPLMKVGVTYIPPIWFGVGRLFIGAVCVFIYLIITKQLHFPVKGDLSIILTVGTLQMALYLIVVNLALVYADAERSSILSYITPLFVIPIAVIFFKEKLTLTKFIGLIVSFIGVGVLFNPLSFNWHDKNMLIANAYLIVTALCWFIAILYARYGHWKSSLLVLTA
jgi:drug/metabolite transporter (DMT)-like permease